MAGVRREAYQVLLAQSGDREALAALLDAIQQPLYRYLVGLRAYFEGPIEDWSLSHVYRHRGDFGRFKSRRAEPDTIDAGGQ